MKKSIQSIAALVVLLSFTAGAEVPVKNNTQQNPETVGTDTRAVENDSVRVSELQEIIIEGKDQYFTAKGAVYTPTKQQKNSSFSAVDLLDKMGIPQLNTSPNGTSVSDKFGNNVPIFINYVAATPNDVMGLKTSDVVKVEYLENPTDPRFGTALKAVNIIVRVYEYGGYTKLYVAEHVLSGLASTARVNSKLSYKNMTYDLYVSANNRDYHHEGTDSKSIFRGVGAESATPKPVREQTMDKGHGVTEQYPVSFRAIYSSNRMSIQNTVGYNYYSQKTKEQSGLLKWFPSSGSDHEYSISSPERSNTLSYNGNWQFFLPGQHSIVVLPTFTYGNTNSDYEYRTTLPTEIIRRSKDRSYYWNVEAYWFKKHGVNTFQVNLTYNGQHNRTNYAGNSVYKDVYDWMMFNVDLSYILSLSNLSLSPRVGYNWSHSDMNSQKEIGMKPYAQLYVNYRISRSHSLQAYIRYDLASAPTNYRSNETFQLNELLYYTGNPNLSRYHNFFVNVGYGFIPDNNFSLFAYGRYKMNPDKVTTVYEPYLDGSAIRRKYVNNGSFKNGTIGVDLSLKLFNRSLQLSVNPEFNMMRLTGDYSGSLNPFTVSARAAYYIGNFYINASYSTRQKDFDYYTNETVTYPQSYFLSAGWGNGAWNIRLSLNNIFRTDWKWGTSEINTANYYEKTESYGQAGHGSISLNVAYTFGYGKQVRRNNEIGAVDLSRSAILK